jgi:hypothetical protein
MQSDGTRSKAGMPIGMILASILMLVGVIMLLVAVTGGHRLLLYGGLCVVGVGVALGALRIILNKNRP